MALAFGALRRSFNRGPSAADARMRPGKTVYSSSNGAHFLLAEVSLSTFDRIVFCEVWQTSDSTKDIDDLGLVGAAVCNCYEIGLRNFLYIPVKSRGSAKNVKQCKPLL